MTDFFTDVVILFEGTFLACWSNAFFWFLFSLIMFQVCMGVFLVIWHGTKRM